LRTWKLTASRYNTKSNKVRVVKTPGGELRYLHIKKAGTAPKCGDCGIKLPGVSLLHCTYVRQRRIGWFGHGNGRTTVKEASVHRN
jgi:ribosomal protein L34E